VANKKEEALYAWPPEIEEITIDINKLHSIFEGIYEGKAVSITGIFTGTRIDNVHTVKLGPGGILDIHVEVKDKMERKNETNKRDIRG